MDEATLLAIFIPVASTLLAGAFLYMIKMLRDIKVGVDLHNNVLFGAEGMKELNIGLVELGLENRKALVQQRITILALVECLMRDGTLKPNEELQDLICVLRACTLGVEPSIRP